MGEEEWDSELQEDENPVRCCEVSRGTGTQHRLQNCTILRTWTPEKDPPSSLKPADTLHIFTSLLTLLTGPVVIRKPSKPHKPPQNLAEPHFPHNFPGSLPFDSIPKPITLYKSYAILALPRISTRNLAMS